MYNVYVDMASGDHGCTSYLVVEFPSSRSRRGVVIDADGCTSAWYVGHDRANAEWYKSLIGRRVWLPYSAATFDRLLEQGAVSKFQVWDWLFK